MRIGKTLFACTCLLFSALATPSNASADKDYYDTWGVTCLKEINGKSYTVGVSIDLENPDKTDTDGFGTARNFHGVDGKLNCDGQRYEYTVVSIDHGWTATADVPVEVDVGGGVIEIQSQTHTFSHADNKAYWDHYYDGYDPPAACDYTKNCHGYAFEIGGVAVGDVVEEVTILTNLGLAAVGGGAAAPISCYEVVGKKDAEVACDVIVRGDESHSIKVTSIECTPEPTGGPQVFPAPPNFWIISESTEQFKESGTYKQTSTCAANDLDLKKAHGSTFDDYKLLKRK